MNFKKSKESVSRGAERK
ncbi:MAG: hypothetical protein LN589_02075 [Rickettsia endosymbiont of Eriopis connexa]|nr:hypothetical protein [Rickettsia endosymbiont of Eriopis connexa]